MLLSFIQVLNLWDMHVEFDVEVQVDFPSMWLLTSHLDIIRFFSEVHVSVLVQVLYSELHCHVLTISCCASGHPTTACRRIRWVQVLIDLERLISRFTSGFQFDSNCMNRTPTSGGCAPSGSNSNHSS